MSELHEKGVVYGKLAVSASLSGVIVADRIVSGVLTLPANAPVDRYEGEYVITPISTGNIVLETNKKLMEDDVTVRKIPYYETSNVYGKTVYIGEDFLNG